MTEEVYHNGRLNGIVHLYNKNGNLAYIDTYQDGVRIDSSVSQNAVIP